MFVPNHPYVAIFAPAVTERVLHDPKVLEDGKRNGMNESHPTPSDYLDRDMGRVMSLRWSGFYLVLCPAIANDEQSVSRVVCTLPYIIVDAAPVEHGRVRSEVSSDGDRTNLWIAIQSIHLSQEDAEERCR